MTHNQRVDLMMLVLQGVLDNESPEITKKLVTIGKELTRDYSDCDYQEYRKRIKEIIGK